MPDAGETEEAVVEPTSLGYFIMQLPDDGNDDGMEPYPITMVGINALQKSHLKFGLTIENGHFRVGRYFDNGASFLNSVKSGCSWLLSSIIYLKTENCPKKVVYPTPPLSPF